MQLPVNAALYGNVYNVIIFNKQGTSFIVGGSFSTVAGTPSQQLLPSTNTVMGYFNGQMLATASGETASGPSTLTAGALINFDPDSTDTGQKVWNGMIICDLGLKFPLPVGVTYPGTLQVATASQGWVIRQQFLYGPGTPATDGAIVTAALEAWGKALVRSQSSNASADGATESIFSY